MKKGRKSLPAKSPESRAVTGELVEGTPFTNPRRAIRLTNPDEIRVEMARVYREAARGKLPTDVATRLVYMLSQINRAYETSVIERRINLLETKDGIN